MWPVARRRCEFEVLRGGVARERPLKNGVRASFRGDGTQGAFESMTVHIRARATRESSRGEREASMKYGLLWLLGVPIPVLIIVYLMFHH
jgi:hypothetical protein